MPDFDVVKYFVQQIQWISSAVDSILKGRPLPSVSNQPGGKVGLIMESIKELSSRVKDLETRSAEMESEDQEFAEGFRGLQAPGAQQEAEAHDFSRARDDLKKAARRIEELILANQALKDHSKYIREQLNAGKEIQTSKNQLEQRLSIREAEVSQLNIKRESLEAEVGDLKSEMTTLKEKVEAETQVFQSLAKVREIISVSLQPEELLKRVCLIPAQIMACQRAATFIRDPASNAFVPVHASGLNQTLIPVFKAIKFAERETPLIDELVSRKRPIFLDDCRKVPTRAKVYNEDGSMETIMGSLPFVPKDYVERFGTHSLLAVPVISRGKIAGIFLVDFGSVRHQFSKTEVAPMESLAQLVGAALDNIHVFHDNSRRLLELERQAGTATVLKEIDESVFSTNEAEQIIGSVINMVPRVIPSEWTSVLLADRLSKGYYVIGNLGHLVRGKGTIPYEHTTFNGVLRADQVLHRPNLRNETQLAELDHHLLSHGIRSDLLFPISISGGISGVLHITSRRVAGFSHEDIVIGQRISGQLAKALGRATAQRVKDRRKGNGYFEMIQSLIDTASHGDCKLGDYRDQMIECGLNIARRFELDEEHQEWIKYAILLHDIGKSTIPDHILNKREILTNKEMDILKTHPIQGAEMIKNFRFIEIIKGMKFVKFVVPLVRHSYERWDGKGYPDGLSGEDIPKGARILSVVNASAAMMMDRPYRKALRPEEAIREIREGAGKQFDPKVVDHFFGYFQDQSN